MGKLKPFLFGAIFGGGIIFVALQYHMIQSDEGFRLVPRTPQPSIGLAYVDSRGFGIDEWADRSEVAQAIIAHGSTDLITASAAGQISDTIAPPGSALDKVRSLLKQTENAFGKSGADQPGLLTIPKDDNSASDTMDLLSIPLTWNKGNQPAANIAATPQPTTVAQRETTSMKVIGDIFKAGSNSVTDIEKPNTQATTPSSRLPSSFDSVAETEALEKMLFGYDEDPAEPSLSTRDSTPGIFEEITSGIEQRVEDSFTRAKSSLQNETTKTLSESTGSIDRYIRDRVQDAVPKSVSSMFQEDVTKTATEQLPQNTNLAPVLKSIQNGFDPFIK
jgi:hypothetical protein